MFYLKIAMIYFTLFAITALVTLKTSFNNPALSFFIPSIFSMMVYAKMKLGAANLNLMKHALSCALIFSVLTVGLSALIQHFYGWLKSPEILYLMAFGGNFIFPFLLFPKIRRAQDS